MYWFLKVLRKDYKMTQADLAERCDRGVATVAAWENGRRNPGKKSLEALTKVFGLDVSELAKEMWVLSEEKADESLILLCAAKERGEERGEIMMKLALLHGSIRAAMYFKRREREKVDGIQVLVEEEQTMPKEKMTKKQRKELFDARYTV